MAPSIMSPAETEERGAPRLLFVVTEDWYFWSHRVELARGARDLGFRVGVATRCDGHADAITAEGFELFPLRWSRRMRSPGALITALGEVRRAIRLFKPDLLHLVALQPMALGGVCALLESDPPIVVSTLAGRGRFFSRQTLMARLGGMALRLLLAMVERRCGGEVITQNLDDDRWLSRFPSVERRSLIRGSGVDAERFHPMVEPEGPFTIAQVSRMQAFKGVAEVIRAVELLRQRGAEIRLILVGSPDAGSAASLSEDDLRAWAAGEGNVWIPHTKDVPGVWRQAHAAVLASHGGEGVPKSLIEAASCGRALIATDVPGNREIVRPGVTGVLCPPHDPAALANAIQSLMDDAATRGRFGAAARRLVEDEFKLEHVLSRTLAVYQRLLDDGAAAKRLTVPPG